jgi:predicted AAA+ superfamily ATPase
MDYKNRHIQEKIRLLAQYYKVILVTGARQTGKSTLLKTMFPEMPLFTFDRHLDNHGARANPDYFLKNSPSPIILDEVQYVPELLSTIKRKVDMSDERGQYFLTGSHNLGLIAAATEGMTGRIGIVNLEHMSVFEDAKTVLFKDGKQNPPSWLEVYLEDPASLMKNFAGLSERHSTVETMWRGGYPEALERPDILVPTYFDDYLHMYLERDALYANPSTASPQFMQYFGLMAALTGQESNHEALMKKLGISRAVAQQWNNVLLQTYQWREVKPYSNNLSQRIVKKPKGYITDTGLAAFVQGIRDSLTLLNSPLSGALFETYCVNLVHQLIEGLYKQPVVYHWRKIGGAEVDLVLHMNGKLYPIEIKLGTSLTKHDMRGIMAFREEHGSSVQHGLILYPGDHCYALSEHVTILPFNALMKPREISIDPVLKVA